jgi:hypothetical protein
MHRSHYNFFSATAADTEIFLGNGRFVFDFRLSRPSYLLSDGGGGSIVQRHIYCATISSAVVSAAAVLYNKNPFTRAIGRRGLP